MQMFLKPKNTLVTLQSPNLVQMFLKSQPGDGTAARRDAEQREHSARGVEAGRGMHRVASRSCFAPRDLVVWRQDIPVWRPLHDPRRPLRACASHASQPPARLQRDIPGAALLVPFPKSGL